MIRKLSKQDKIVLSTWARQLVFSPSFNWTPDSLLESLESDHVWGCYWQNEIVSALAEQVQPDHVEILWLATLPNFEGKGFMKQLLAHRAHDALNHSRQVLLEVHEKNAKALKLYLQMGFARVGIRKSYYNDGGHALLMTLSRPQNGP